MHHSYLDKYARGSSLLHRLDPRTKAFLTFAGVILLASTPRPGWVFLFSGVVITVALTKIAQIPLRYLITRSAVVIPFAGFAIVSYLFTVTGGEVYFRWGPLAMTSEGAALGARLLTRAWLSVSLVILLINTTPFDRLLNALHWFKVPGVLVMLLGFFYRYLYLLWDEAERLQRARNLRYFGGKPGAQPAVLGHLVSALFLRSYQRSMRIQAAMTARGWDGSLRNLPSRPMNGENRLVLILGVVTLILLWLMRSL